VNELRRLNTVASVTVVTLAIFGFASSRWCGAEEPLVTDRPDFTERSSTVGRGVLQLDVRVARRLSDGGPDLLVGAGASWRIGG
jgi:hypothetical protein